MQLRWLIVDWRYFSVSLTHEGPDIEDQDPQHCWIFDLTPRPIFTLHIASVRGGFPRCVNFVFLCTSFPGFSYQSDILETDETCFYPPEGPSALTFALYCWAVIAQIVKYQWANFKRDSYRLKIHFPPIKTRTAT